MHAEVGRLQSAGLLLERRLGQARLVRANLDHVLTRPLIEQLEMTYGRSLFCRWSWPPWTPYGRRSCTGVVGGAAVGRVGAGAARPGRRRHRLPARAQIADASLLGGRRLHREVNITRIAPAVWDAGEDSFVRTLTSRPLVRLDLETAHGGANDQ